MKSMMKTVLLGCLFLTAATAANAADPVVGEWKLDVAKSTFKPGPAPKSQMRTYADTPLGLLLTIKTVLPDGKEQIVMARFKDDGSDYPILGTDDFDTIAVKRVDESTVNSTQKKAGKVVGHGVRSVAKDGKTLSFKSMGLRANGKMSDDNMVYDRQ